MAKAKKKAKAKAKKASAKKAKKVVKKSAKKKSAVKKKKVKKAAARASKLSSKKAKAAPKKEEPKQIIDIKPIPLPKALPLEKPAKEAKKSKEDHAEERDLNADDSYSWDSGSFSDMKNYEPTPVFRKPDPPQPKFKGKKDNRTRYSDKELQEFRDIINDKLGEAERDYELLKNTLAHRDEQGTDDTSPTFKVLEDGSDAMSREEIAQLASRQEKHIQNLKNALIRIENKTYGICRVTGKLIPKERLRSVPHATLSIEAKLMQNS